jgi:hypothetical protein
MATPSPTHHDHHALSILLTQKLKDIPANHLPPLTLRDIANSTPAATHIPTIPPDIQLTFFLANRPRINRQGGIAIKDASEQGLAITRAIWYYRIDEDHQFQRYHDTNRWNVAMFLALLVQDDMLPSLSIDLTPASPSPPVPPPRFSYNSMQRITPHTPPLRFRLSTSPLFSYNDQRRTTLQTPADERFRLSIEGKDFIISYLSAVLEHHNNPTQFTTRDAFIRMWKRSKYEFFSLGANKKKVMKGEMKRLTGVWETVLDMKRMAVGREKYEERVAGFVGVLVPGKKNQRKEELQKGEWEELQRRVRKRREGGGEEREETKGLEDEVEVDIGQGEVPESDLLKALKVPLEDDEDGVMGGGGGKRENDGETILPVAVAIEAVKITKAEDILRILMERFG